MKKETKTSKSTSKKNTRKYTYVVDLTKAETAADVYDAFIDAKIKAGLPISEVEMIITKAHIIDMIIDTINMFQNSDVLAWNVFSVKDITTEFDKNVYKIDDDKFAKDLFKLLEKHTIKKDPWYKRAWKWVKKPFTRKKK